MDYDVRVAVSGRVLLDDRQPPPEPIPVEYSCRGASRATLTDAKGRFSIGIDYQQAGRTNLSYNLPDVAGCRVQIRLPGFEEVLVTLKRPQALSDLHVGDRRDVGRDRNRPRRQIGERARTQVEVLTAPAPD